MRCCLAVLLVLASVVGARAEDDNPSLDRLIRLGEIPLERAANIGGIIAAKPMDFVDSTSYLKTMVPPTVLPFQKSTTHIVLLVNLSQDIMRPEYYLCFFNPKDVVVHRGPVPTIRVVYKDGRRHDKGIWVHLAMPTFEPSQASMGPAGSAK